MNFVHAILEVIGALSILGSIFLIIIVYCEDRNHLDRFSNPNEPRWAKINKLPWVKR